MHCRVERTLHIVATVDESYPIPTQVLGSCILHDDINAGPSKASPSSINLSYLMPVSIYCRPTITIHLSLRLKRIRENPYIPLNRALMP